jgi:hypothetical protein
MKKEIAMGIDLFGHGGLHLSACSWSACHELAASFGWTPGPRLASDDPALYDYWVDDRDAREFALALYRAVRELENGLEPTAELTEILRDTHGLALIRELADYAFRGGFGVG